MTTSTPTVSTDEPAWFVGFDWGSEKHRAALFDRTGNLIACRDVAHSAAPPMPSSATGCCAPRQASPAEIAVAILETTHGPVVDALIDRGFRVYAINPKQLDRFRDRYSVAGAKDDTRDADTLGRSLRHQTLRRSARSQPRQPADRAVARGQPPPPSLPGTSAG